VKTLNILIAPDKFKGTLTASEAAKAIGQGWQRARPEDHLDLLPITDGGDGFGDAISKLWNAEKRTLATMDAAHRPLRALWWWHSRRRTAIIESAAVIGLAQLPPKRFHPFRLDTYGLGKVIRAAIRQGARKCLIGVGGSATNDGGFGLARALGWQFRDDKGTEIRGWTLLSRLRHIVPAQLSGVEIVVAVDVGNPLLGPRGATRVYGPQKGLGKSDFAKAEQCLRRLAAVVKKDLGIDVATLPGAGAAGGLAYGLAVFLGARLEAGFELFAREADLQKKLRKADLVITGEGRLDRSSMMGKGVGEIAHACRKLKIPCIALAGDVARTRELGVFARTAGLTDLTSYETAIRRPELWLRRLAEMVATDLKERQRKRTTLAKA
jgi:glycerate kinase